MVAVNKTTTTTTRSSKIPVLTRLKAAPTQAMSKTVVITSAPKKKKKKMGKASKSGYLSALLNPFNGSVANVPDDQVALSGNVRSMYNARSNFVIENGSNDTSHRFGFIMMPYPGCGWVEVRQLNNSDVRMTDTGTNGTAARYFAVPNASSLYGGSPYSCKVRCVSMGIKIIYEGTELQRAGRVFAGLGSNTDIPSTLASTGTQYSPLSAFTGVQQPTIDKIRNSLSEVVESRISDGVYSARWKPSGCPSYQIYGTTTRGTAADATPTGTTSAETLFQVPPGGAGCQAGQNLLVVMVEGDTTQSASNSSNPYAVEMVWNWEVITDNPTAVSYPSTPSPMNMNSLQSALNSIQTTSIGGYGKASSMGFRAGGR